MKSVFISILMVLIFLCAVTIGGMTLSGMTHQMDMDGSYAPETMICLDHCLKAFAPETIIPTILAFLLITVMFTFRSSRHESVVRLEHHFGRWREIIATFLRHQSLSTIVLRD